MEADALRNGWKLSRAKRRQMEKIPCSVSMTAAVREEITMSDDAELLRRYADTRDETAFAELVRQHLGLVYHAALRQCGGDAHRAEDVAQMVFADLARKSEKLSRRPVLAGWLYTSTRYAAAQAVRTEARRQAREREVHAMNQLLSENNSEPASEWERLRPVIDDALHALGERDREAVLLRFFEARGFAEVGRRLAVSEDAARMRVERALEKMRTTLSRRGVISTTTALAVALTSQTGAAVPAGIAASVTVAALASVVPVTVAAATVGVLSFMSTTKFIAGTAGLIALVAAGTAISGLRATRSATLMAASLRSEHEAMRTQLSELRSRLRQIEESLAATQKGTAGARVEWADTNSALPRPAEAPNPPPASEGGPAAIESAKGALAHIGNLGPNPRVENSGLDAAAVAAIREWMKRDPKAALQWVASVPAERNQQLHTIEAFIAIEEDGDPELAFLLANSIGLETSRVARLVDVLKVWAPRDPAAAGAAVQTADVSEEKRAFLLKKVEIESRPRR